MKSEFCPHLTQGSPLYMNTIIVSKDKFTFSFYMFHLHLFVGSHLPVSYCGGCELFIYDVLVSGYTRMNGTFVHALVCLFPDICFIKNQSKI